MPLDFCRVASLYKSKDTSERMALPPDSRLAIDHLAHSPDLKALDVRTLSNFDAGGKRLSDHFGLAVRLRASGGSASGGPSRHPRAKHSLSFAAKPLDLRCDWSGSGIADSIYDSPSAAPLAPPPGLWVVRQGAAPRRTQMAKSTSKPSAGSQAKAPAKAAAEDRARPAAKAASKAATIIGLLRRENGATLDEMTEATGWQKHSVRGFMAGALKKQHGLAVSAEKANRGRVYRIADAVQQ